MVDVQSVFDACDIDPNVSIHRNIHSVSNHISEASDPLGKCNQIIKRLGGSHVLNTTEAQIIARSMIEQAIMFTLQKRTFDPEHAMQVAKIRVADMKVKHPYLFVMKENSVEAVATTKRGRKSGDKKAKALAIFEANRGKKASDIAKLIQVELGITFANAYYYVSRVFK